MHPEQPPVDMAAIFDERLTAFGERLREEPLFAFLRELPAEHPNAEVYVVGGIVRDACLDREAKDYDFVIRGVPAEELRAFLEARGTVNLVGRNFGVFKFRPHGWPADAENIDIALPRTEHADGTGGYRDFDVQADHTLPVATDLSRRDFTINAMAWDVARGALVDPFGGRADLEQKIIRAVGSPAERFTEDRSRMLRALRFAAQLGATIDTETMAAMREGMEHINARRVRAVRYLPETEQIVEVMIPCAPAIDLETDDLRRVMAHARAIADAGLDATGTQLEQVPGTRVQFHPHTPHPKTTPINRVVGTAEFVTPRETIAKELIKSFLADPVHSLDLWDDAGAIAQLIPELLAMKDCEQPEEYHSEGTVWVHTRSAHVKSRSPEYREEFGETPPNALETIATLLHDVGKPPTKKTPEHDGVDRVRFDGHDMMGGQMARAIARRLALSSPFPKGDPKHIDIEDLGWIIDHHLLLLADPNTMRNATIEKYFFNPSKPGDVLQRVTFCDASASIPNGAERADLMHFRALRQRIREIAALRDEAARLPPAVLDGKEIMQRLGVRPGKKVGELKDALREEQLRIALTEHRAMTEEEAIAFLTPLAHG